MGWAPIDMKTLQQSSNWLPSSSEQRGLGDNWMNVGQMCFYFQHREYSTRSVFLSQPSRWLITSNWHYIEREFWTIQMSSSVSSSTRAEELNVTEKMRSDMTIYLSEG